jgi:hypothetical protein
MTKPRTQESRGLMTEFRRNAKSYDFVKRSYIANHVVATFCKTGPWGIKIGNVLVKLHHILILLCFFFLLGLSFPMERRIDIALFIIIFFPEKKNTPWYVSKKIENHDIRHLERCPALELWPFTELFDFLWKTLVSRSSNGSGMELSLNLWAELGDEKKSFSSTILAVTPLIRQLLPLKIKIFDKKS